MNRFVLRQSLILFLTAVIWGLGFIAQSVGMDYVEPFTFTASRNILAFFVLIPYIAVTDKRKQKNDTSVINKHTLWIGGMLRHLPLCSEQPAAVWRKIHDGWKSRIYHGDVHGACADIRHFSA